MMKIINELSLSQIKNNKKDAFATKVSILLAVILLGTIIFIIGQLNTQKYQEIKSTIGDYNVSLADVNNDMINKLLNDKDIKKVSFDKYINTNLDAVIIEKGKYNDDLNSFNIISGRKPQHFDEIIVPARFLVKNKEYKIGKNIKIKDKLYKIVGEYNDYGRTFEELAFIGCLDESKENILNNDGIVAYIWYQNPRDTYSLTKKILSEFKIDEKNAIDTGRLYFNRDFLECKMIYPTGFMPPKHIIKSTIEIYGPIMLLVFLFAVMIYGAFNVYNSRDIREISLLKSVGMTDKQVKKMIRKKAINMGIIPILLGIVISYGVANLLLYLMYINNSLTYKNMSKIFGEKMLIEKFEFISLSFSSIIIIFIFSFLTVYLSAIIPARKSAKISVVQGLNGIINKKTKYGKSKIKGRIENTLASDYFKSYSKTYKTIIIALLLSFMVMNIVSVSQSYKIVNSKYQSFNSPYNFISQIYTENNLDENMIDDLENIKDIKNLHIYETKDFKFYLDDNKGFESNELQNTLKIGDKIKKDLFVRMIGLAEEDYDYIINKNRINKNSNYILLNKIPDSNNKPYAFRNYIKLSSTKNKAISVKYNMDGKNMIIPIDDYINEIPFDLEGQSKNAIYIFTRRSTLDNFIEKYGQDPAEPVNYYTIQFKGNKNLDKESENASKIINSYIAKNDYSISNDIIKKAMNDEERRNRNMLNFGIQLILILIALSNAYNSFHGNLRSRKIEFQLLFTVGMTDKQIKKMIYNESKILFNKLAFLYIITFIFTVAIRSFRSQYEFSFIAKEIIFNINYIPMIAIFIITIGGILISIKSGIDKVLNEDTNNIIKER